MDNSKNCIFDETQLIKVTCDGIFVKIGAKAQARETACM